MSKIREYLYLETDDTCALCGKRGRNKLTIHHIDENRTNNDYENLVVLCYNCHNLYNKNKISKSIIIERKRRLIKKTLTQYGVNAIKMAIRNSKGKVIVASFSSLSFSRFRFYESTAPSW